MTNLQSACQPDRKVRRDPPCTLGRPVPHFSETLPSTLPFPWKSPQDGKKGQPELVVPTGLLMSGRLDSNQRPPEPHSGALAKLRHAPILPPCYRLPHRLSRPPPLLHPVPRGRLAPPGLGAGNPRSERLLTVEDAGDEARRVT